MPSPEPRDLVEYSVQTSHAPHGPSRIRRTRPMKRVMSTTIEATTDAPDRNEPCDDTSVRLLRPPAMELPVLLPPPVGLSSAGIAPPPPVDATPVIETIPNPPVVSAAVPSTMFAADAAMVPADFGLPMLPTPAPLVPTTPNSAPGAGSAFDIGEFLATPGSGRQAPPTPRGRGIRRLLLVAILGAGGWAGVTYGPGLYNEYAGNGSGTAEVPAPLAFPTASGVDARIRTAEFVLVGLPESPGATYRIITDFETAVSQVDITRDDGPSLQILTYGDDAMIRRADADEWYLLDRGQFPLDGRLARSDWVRTLDELLPSSVRGGAVITDSTESTISGVATRRLTLSIDPALFGPAPTESASIDSAPIDPAVADQIAAAVPVPPVDAAAPSLVASPDAIAPDALPDADASTPAETPGAMIDIELWIDGNGLVRQVSGATPRFGAETITIVRISPDSWIPAYPPVEQIAPLTASALVDLGL